MQMRASPFSFFFCFSLALFSGLLWGRERQLHVHTGSASDPCERAPSLFRAWVKIASSEPWDDSSHRGVFHLQPWFVLIRPVMCESVCKEPVSRTTAAHRRGRIQVVHVCGVETHQADGFIAGFSLPPVCDCLTDQPAPPHRPTAGMHTYSEIRLLCCSRCLAALLAPFNEPPIRTIRPFCTFSNVGKRSSAEWLLFPRLTANHTH